MNIDLMKKYADIVNEASSTTPADRIAIVNEQLRELSTMIFDAEKLASRIVQNCESSEGGSYLNNVATVVKQADSLLNDARRAVFTVRS